MCFIVNEIIDQYSNHQFCEKESCEQQEVYICSIRER